MIPFAIPFPPLSPDLFSLEIGSFNLALRWYALAYIAGLLIGWRMAVSLVKRPELWRDGTPPMSPENVEALLTWVILGVIIGGRLGFVLFYQPDYYLANPLEILMVWQGGMSFHGGLTGVIVAGLIFCLRIKAPILRAADMMAMATPVGLFLGRIANFVNAELWGRPSQVPWAVVFPGASAQNCPVDWTGVCGRHPSQLYEAALEGIVLLGLLLWLVYRRGALKTPGFVTGVFFVGYGVARALVELVRQPDAQFVTETNPIGYVWQIGEFGLTMGQILSLPMIALGLGLILGARMRRT